MNKILSYIFSEKAHWHFIVNLIIVIIFGKTAGLFVGVPSAVIISVGKELIDKYVRKTKFSVVDIIADVLGIIAGTAAALAMPG